LGAAFDGMKVLLKINLADKDTETRLASDAEIRAATRATNTNPIWFNNPVDAESPIFDRILELSRAGKGIKFLRHTTFTKGEISRFGYFELLPQTAIADSKEEYNATWRHYMALPRLHTQSKWPIKLLDRLYLRSARVKRDTLAGYGEWTCEYVLGKGVAKLIVSSGLSGVETIPVYGIGNSKPLENCFQLFSKNVLPAVDPDVSVFESHDSGPRARGKPRRYGSMAYRSADLATALDFNRTAEPWGPWDFPSWVVSRNAREVLSRNRIRARYLPVFESGTEAHRQYVEKWQRVLDKLRTNPRHEIWA
jgi:hypothetical protein